MCLHSGVFTRAQFCHYFDTDRKRALRFVRALVERRQAVESERAQARPPRTRFSWGMAAPPIALGG